MNYCPSIYRTLRRETSTVRVGKLCIGSQHPICIQSMTTSSTRDVEGTVDQIMRLADSGCPLVRVTVQGMKEAESCEGIKELLLQKGYDVPLVADIHFYPPAALKVAGIVDKVRINPGNFVDKRATFRVIEYDDASYALEIEKIAETFSPLVEKCKASGCAMRIGVNHGSLSDRIMNRYGDTPAGMVESAFEFTRICRALNYHNLLFSMKSSNPQVMIQAYRLLVAEMNKLGWDYPLHLGVTEAGEGEDGRVKSAMGIGALLLDGLGDTIRVSLTEDPWKELAPCKRLIDLTKRYATEPFTAFTEKKRNFLQIERRPIVMHPKLPLHPDGPVLLLLPKQKEEEIREEGTLLAASLGFKRKEVRPQKIVADDGEASAKQFARKQSDREEGMAIAMFDERYEQNAGRGEQASPELFEDVRKEGWKATRQAVDGLIVEGDVASLPEPLRALQKEGVLLFQKITQQIDSTLPFLSLKQLEEQVVLNSLPELYALVLEEEPVEEWDVMLKHPPAALFFSPHTSRVQKTRALFEWLSLHQLTTPLILHFHYAGGSQEQLVIEAAAECGALLCDGIGEGLCLHGPYPLHTLRALSLTILQAARRRSVRTDFISCPGCGRTLFNLQETTARIHARTHHLPGVKIAIMGCIVNGPGEMADADFGYVGSKAGKVDLYVGKKCVQKDIDFAEADEQLVALIQAHGRWVEPSEEA